MHPNLLSDFESLLNYAQCSYFNVFACSTLMTVPVTGGASTPFGPPDFIRIGDLHIHMNDLKASGLIAVKKPSSQYYCYL